MAKKSIRSRIRITKSGKMLRRKRGQSHARALKSRQLIRRRRPIAEVSEPNRKTIIQQLSI
ncbi:MAG: 50S ribosomal protein L35 [Candidatus Colwellbacteria bacterium]|nr:50S ribosomal protein L35 [Candidatus Colwellbacteria bacterium]